MSQKAKFYLIVTIQIIFIAGMIIFHQMALVSGKKILLKIVPIDPFDLFRGYYAHLRYDISEVFTGDIKVDKDEFRRGEYIYVILSKQSEEKFYKIIAVNHSKPVIGPNEVIIRGRVMDSYDRNRCKVWVQTENGIIKEYTSYRIRNIKFNDKVVLDLTQDGQISDIYIKNENFTPPTHCKFEYGSVLKIEEKKGKSLNIVYNIESYFAEKRETQRIERSRREEDVCAEISLDKDGKAMINRVFLNDQSLLQ